ncbi:hypothetical protein [Leptospira perolatii]|uniref:hypothetical protein n=1 Tax=Leptospira perolatii TaxID=2023191 RepID=UPI000F62D8C4|nr:hypothetical protein [Leptospira perolatii]
MKQKITRASVLAGLGAGFLWGSWAYYVHAEYGIAVAGKAAATQFVGSSILGTIMTMIMDWVFVVEGASPILKKAGSIFLPVIFAFSVLFIVHLFNGTPNILKTILPSQPVGLAWTVAYTFKLYRGAGREYPSRPIS